MTEGPQEGNPNWAARIRQIGRDNFVREEMLRLGFFSKQVGEAERAELQSFLEQAYPRIAELKSALNKIRREIATSEDLQSLIKEVRRERIARVRREREERRARKAAEAAERRAARAEVQRRTPGFLGHGVSGRLCFDGGDATRLSARGLPQAADLVELAARMTLDPNEVLWLCYERAATTVDHYVRFEIPKKSGGRRLISSPKPKLRAAQGWILREILGRLMPSAQATAFQPGKSIVDNAMPHLDAAIVVRMDLQDFFPSIAYPRVRGWFEHLGYNPGVASVLALLCTDAPRVKLTLDGEVRYVAMGERALPQGACTSPALANLIASPLDARLNGLCASVDDIWTYTRYADDLSFSCRNGEADVGRLLQAVTRIVADEGFRLNDRKTAVMRAPGRRMVTGLVVGESLRLSRRDLRRLRAFLHRCERDGVETVTAALDRDALAIARGHLAYVAMVMPEFAAGLRRRHAWL